MNKSEIWKNYRFPIILLSGIMIGAVIGVIFGEKAKVLAPLGDIFLNLMFTIVVPMVFVSISSAVGNMVAFSLHSVERCVKIKCEKVLHITAGGEPTLPEGFYYYFVPGATEKLIVEVAKESGDFEAVRTINLAPSSIAEGWTKVTIPLKDFISAEFIQIGFQGVTVEGDRKSTRLNSSHT